MRLFLATLFAVAAALGVGWYLWADVFAANVTLAEVRRGKAAEIVYATGVVEPLRWAKVIALQRKRSSINRSRNCRSSTRASRRKRIVSTICNCAPMDGVVLRRQCHVANARLSQTERESLSRTRIFAAGSVGTERS